MCWFSNWNSNSWVKCMGPREGRRSELVAQQSSLRAQVVWVVGVAVNETRNWQGSTRGGGGIVYYSFLCTFIIILCLHLAPFYPLSTSVFADTSKCGKYMLFLCSCLLYYNIVKQAGGHSGGFRARNRLCSSHSTEYNWFSRLFGHVLAPSAVIW